MRRIYAADGANLVTFVSDVVVRGSVVHTDAWQGYAGLAARGYDHQKIVLRGRSKRAASELLPRVHLVVSLLKRWLVGTHQGAVSPEHLDYYLDEFASASIDGVLGAVVFSSCACSRMRSGSTPCLTRPLSSEPVSPAADGGH